MSLCNICRRDVADSHKSGSRECYLDGFEMLSMENALLGRVVYREAELRAENERLRGALREIKDEVDKADAWHRTTGMKVAKTPRVMPSVVHWLKPIVDAALAPVPSSAEPRSKLGTAPGSQ